MAKTAFLTTLSVHNVLLVLENLHISRSLHKVSLCCSVQLPTKKKWTQKKPSSLSAQQEQGNVCFIWCMFIYKCGVTEQRTRSKKWILHFTLKTQMSTVNMISRGGDFQISWAKCHIFALSLTASLFQEHIACAGHDFARDRQWENSYAGIKCSNLIRKKKLSGILGESWEERKRRSNYLCKAIKKTRTCCNLQYANSIIKNTQIFIQLINLALFQGHWTLYSKNNHGQQ